MVDHQSRPPQVTSSTSKYQQGGMSWDTEFTMRQQQLSHGPQLADGMNNREHSKTLRSKRDDQQRRRKNKHFLGNKTDHRLQSGSGKTTIIVQYVKKHYENDDIKRYMNDEDVEVHKIQTVSHPDSLTKSFKVEINYSNKTKVISEDFWPQGIGCRIWRPQRNADVNQQGALVNVVGQNQQPQTKPSLVTEQMKTS